MHRIGNIYDWKNLRHWLTALTNGKVAYMNEQKIAECGDHELENALWLLSQDCFPISLICFYFAEDECRILLTPLWKSIFRFLNNGRGAQINGRKAYFNEITDDEQKSFLHASISAIWMSN